MIINILLPLIGILGFSICLSNKLRIDIFGAPILVISSVAVIIYLADFVGFAYHAVVIIQIIGSALFVYFILQNLSYYFRNLIKNTDFAVIFVVSLIVIYMSSGVKFDAWDEFSHWGTVIKFLYFKSSLIGQNESLYFRDYPPGLAYIAYYFMGVTGYNESVSILSYNFLALFCLLPLYALFKNQNILLKFYFFIFFFVAGLKFGQGWGSVLSDQSIGFVFMCSSVLVWRYREKDDLFVLITPLLSFLVICKQTGIYFSIAVLLIGVTLKISMGGLNVKKIVKLYFIPLLFLLSIWLSWKYFIFYHGISPSVASANPFILFSKFINCCESEKEKFIFYSMINAIHRGYNSPALFLFVTSVSMGFLAYLINSKKIRYSFLSMALLVVFLGISYLFILLLFYLYAFGEVEGRGLASFVRFYMPINFLIISMLMIGFSEVIRSNSNPLRNRIIISLFCLCTSVGVVLYWKTYQQYGNMYKYLRYDIQSRLNYVTNRISGDASVMLMWENDGKRDSSGIEYWIARYEIAPRISKSICYSVSSNSDDIRNGDCLMKYQEFIENARNYNYIVFLNGINEFKRKYPEIQFNGNVEATVYKVVIDKSAKNSENERDYAHLVAVN